MIESGEKLDILLSVMTVIRRINVFSSTGYFVFMMLMLPSTSEALLGTTAPRLGTRGNTFIPSSQFFMVNPGVKAPPDIEREVSRLGKSGRTDEAISLYYAASRPTIRLLNGAIDACSRARPPRLEQAFELLTDGVDNKSLHPNVFTFGSLISACARARNADLAMKVLRSMEEEYGVQPNAVVYSTVISACSREATATPNLYKVALNLLTEVESKELNMSVVGYNTALSACSNAGKWDAAIKLLEKMETRGIVDVVSYGTVMAACEKGEQWSLVLHYADTMISKGFSLDGLAVTSALHACQQKGMALDALRYLDLLKASPKMSRRKTAGWERSGTREPLEGPDNVAYRLAISACARGGEWRKGINLLSEMKTVTGSVDVIAYTSAITGCEYAGEWKAAFSVLEMMRRDGVEPNEVTIAAAIGACATACARGLDVDLALSKGLQLLQVTKKDPNVVKPNIEIYNAAIRACAEAKKPDLAFKIFEDAKKQGLLPTFVTFGSLMTACERAPSAAHMDKAFQLMKDSQLEPNEIIYGAAISCMRKTSQAERAFLVLKNMIRENLQPNVVTFNTVLVTLSESRRMSLEDLITVYKMMLSSETSKPNRQTYSILIRAFCMNKKPQGAEAFLKRMRQNGIKPDVDLYTMTVSAYEKSRQPIRAVRLMETMEEVGIDFYSVKVLNNAFKNALKLVNVVGKSLGESESDEEWTRLI